MRRFLIGLVAGLIGVWLIVRWRFQEGDYSAPLVSDADVGRIALPDLPWAGNVGEDVPEVEPAVRSETEVAGDLAEGETVQPTAETAQPVEGLMAYCARCRTKREIADATLTTAEDGRPAVRGTCPKCGANMFRFVKASAG